MNVSDIMRRSFATIKSDAPLSDAAHLLMETNQRGPPMLAEDDGEWAGPDLPEPSRGFSEARCRLPFGCYRELISRLIFIKPRPFESVSVGDLPMERNHVA
jgi:CBS domain-containing protein